MTATAPLRIVIAPDSFKGTLSAAGVADAIARGWRTRRPHDELVLVPQADGGEGTLDAVEAAVPGSVRQHVGSVTGPDGRPTPGDWLLLPDGTGVAELAGPSGLPLMARPDPLGAHTIGLGEVIAHALAHGVRRLVVGLGGSASTDGGAGALSALGLRMTDAGGRPLAPGGGALARLAAIDRAALPPLPPEGIALLSDVDAPLLGPRGAAAVFGPQKGAGAAEVALLDAALHRFAELLGGDPDRPGAGAAGGTGYGLGEALGATLLPGADHLAVLTGLDAALDGADVLLSGEGRFDATSLTGKVVGRAVSRAHAAGARCGIIAGRVDAAPVAPDGTTIPAWELIAIAGSVERAMGHPAHALEAAGARAADSAALLPSGAPR